MRGAFDARGHARQDAPRLARERKRLESLRENNDAPGTPCAPGEVKEAIRALMWDKAGVEKDARGINEALEEFSRMRRELLPRQS